MAHGQKILTEWTEEEKIEAIQDYQEMVGELESEVNKALIGGTMILPMTVRGILEKWVYGSHPYGPV